MKIIFLVAVVVLCATVGRGIANTYIERKKFFYSLCEFVKNLKSEINFSMNKLLDILGRAKQNTKDKNLVILLNNYQNILQAGENLKIDSLLKGINVLKDQEQDCLLNFFNGLGKTDALNQIEHLQNSLSFFEVYYKFANDECLKYCPLYTKLGVLVGLFVALIVA